MTTKTFWRIEIDKGLENISSLIVPSGQISEKKIEELLKALMCKYMLDDEEALSSFCKERTKRHHDFLKYHKETSNLDRFRAMYSTKQSSISIDITLIYADELTQTEKMRVTKTSSFKLISLPTGEIL